MGLIASEGRGVFVYLLRPSAGRDLADKLGITIVSVKADEIQQLRSAA